MPLPDFVIIGAMKCGTSTLAAQLAAQEGVFLTTPKEPNFFSDDEMFARGLSWYERLFDPAPEGALKGEASTHYTKLPTHPHAAERLHAAVPEAKLIYITRDPVERLISHYIHEWTRGAITVPLEQALDRHPEMIAYSRYEMQLEPWRRLFGEERILRLTLEEMEADPQSCLDQVAAFLGRPGSFLWRSDMGRVNVSSQRLREFPFYDLVVKHPVATALRRAFIPRALRDRVKARLTMADRPDLPEDLRLRLATMFENAG